LTLLLPFDEDTFYFLSPSISTSITHIEFSFPSFSSPIISAKELSPFFLFDIFQLFPFYVIPHLLSFATQAKLKSLFISPVSFSKTSSAF
jgi:hypothetical protein